MKSRTQIRYVSLVLLSFLLTVIQIKAQYIDSTTIIHGHPRLLLLQGQEKYILANVSGDKSWKKVHGSIIAYSKEVLSKPVLERIKIGRRLLDVSRECLRRVFYLAYSYRLTKDDKYFKRAEKELLAVSAFSDWNPSHFLDVAEMTMGVAIGYDWLYNALPETSRAIIKEAILQKGIKPSLEAANNGWLRNSNNWNQVCNAGMVYGALAIYEDNPALSLQIINRAIETVALPMQQYAPDGAYPEGYGYWEYGTSFNVMLLDALQAAFNSDFSLAAKAGFLQTPFYLQNMTGVTGRPFNYADSREIAEFNPAMFWFGGRLKNPSLLWITRKQIAGSVDLKNRLLPAAMIWGKGINLNKVSSPNSLMWVGNGVNPVALMRTSWVDSNAIFVGFKGGSPSVSHAHMDVGSFIMEANGVRWAMDFGMQEYESLESKKINLWDGKQTGQRWKIFRYHNQAHNTITINDSLQLVKGSAPIISHSTSPQNMNAVVDMTSLYGKVISKLTRKVSIKNKSFVEVFDEVETGKDSITFRWSMVTPANVRFLNNSTAELKKNGKTLLLKVQAPYNVVMKTWATTPTTGYDAPNPGTTTVGYEVRIPANSKQGLTVTLMPQGK